MPIYHWDRAALILLDDASPSEEEAALDKWTQDFGRAIDVARARAHALTSAD